MSDQSKLLDQLTIDRNSITEKSTFSATSVVVTSLITATLSILTTLYFTQSAPQTNLISSDAQASNLAPTVVKTPETPTVKPNHTDSILNASGYITARRTATVSSKITGLITLVNVEEGMIVKKGELLAELDAAVARVDLKLAEAKVKSLQAQRLGTEATIAEAKRVLHRLSRLNGDNYSSEADLSQSTTNLQSLAASIASSDANIEVAQWEVQRQRELLLNHTIRAPFSGIVTVKNAQPGEIVSPSSAGGGFTRTGICTIVDMTSLEIEVDVNESFIGRVFPDQRVKANLDAYPNWDIPASVIAIIPTADRSRATVRVRIRIEANNTRILPEMGVKVAFFQKSSNINS